MPSRPKPAPSLTESDISAIVARSYSLNDRGLGGACIPATVDDGEVLVAILDTSNEDIPYGFGRDQFGYFVFDTDGKALAHSGRSIHEVLSALP